MNYLAYQKLVNVWHYLLNVSGDMRAVVFVADLRNEALADLRTSDDVVAVIDFTHYDAYERYPVVA